MRLNKKSNLFLVFVILNLINCSINKESSSELIHPTSIRKMNTHVKIDTCSIDLDITYLFNYKKFSTNGILYAGYNNQIHSIDLFDLEKQLPIQQLRLFKEGPESVQRVEGIYFHNLDSIFVLSDNYLMLFNSEGKLSNRISINGASPNELFQSYYFTAGNERNNIFFDRNTNCMYLQANDVKISQCSKEHFSTNLVGKIYLNKVEFGLLPISFSSLYNENYYGFNDQPEFSLVAGGKIVYNFPIESSVYFYDLNGDSVLSYGGESSFSPSMASPLSWSSCRDTDEKMRHFIENVKYCRIIYDSYNNLYYRFHHGEAKEKNPDGSFKNVNQKAQYLTVFND